MAILEIWEAGERGGGDESSIRGPVRNYTRKFGVRVSEGSEAGDHEDFMNNASIPSRLSLYPHDPLSICRRRRFDQDSEEPWLYWVTCDYSNQPLDGERPDEHEDPNPLNRPADISWDSEEVRIAVYKDLDGKPILNTAHQKYETALEVEYRRRVITIVKNYATYDDSTAENYENKVSSAIFLNKAAGTVYCKRISARRMFEGNIYFFQVMFQFMWDVRGWKANLVSVGNQELVSTSPMKWKPITDNGGIPISTPVLLTNTGTKASGNPPTPYVQEYRVKDVVDFNGLGI